MKPALHKMYVPRTATTDTLVRVGVAILLRDDDGRILLEKRSDCGLWGLPGGRIDPGETITQAAERETKEETGFTVEVVRLAGVYSDPTERIVTFPDNVVHLIDVLVEVKILAGELTCSAESETLAFFDPLFLPSDIVPPARMPLQDVVDGLSGTIR
jgi:8-oxo-dGTP pyrophosphatase MutT (NUDIX family)